MTVISLWKGGICGKSAGEQTTGERHAGNEANAFGLRGGQQFLNEFLPKDVEDDLQAGETGLLKAEQAFLHGLNTHAPMSDQPLALKGA